MRSARRTQNMLHKVSVIHPDLLMTLMIVLKSYTLNSAPLFTFLSKRFSESKQPENQKTKNPHTLCKSPTNGVIWRVGGFLAIDSHIRSFIQSACILHKIYTESTQNLHRIYTKSTQSHQPKPFTTNAITLCESIQFRHRSNDHHKKCPPD